MTPNEFIIWIKGFVQAANNYNITPKQWDDIKEQLSKVKEITHNGGYVISTDTGTIGTVTTTAERRGDTTYKTDVPTTNTI